MIVEKLFYHHDLPQYELAWISRIINTILLHMSCTSCKRVTVFSFRTFAELFLRRRIYRIYTSNLAICSIKCFKRLHFCVSSPDLHIGKKRFANLCLGARMSLRNFQALPQTILGYSFVTSFWIPYWNTYGYGIRAYIVGSMRIKVGEN